MFKSKSSILFAVTMMLSLAAYAAGASTDAQLSAAITEKVQSASEYPRLANMRGQEGQAVVHVKLSRAQPAPIDIKLAASSGFGLLDQAALDAVAKLDSSVIPAERGNEVISVKVPVTFKLLDNDPASRNFTRR